MLLSTKVPSLFFATQMEKSDTWDAVVRTMRRGCVWCIRIYRTIFSLLAWYYRCCVQVLDYHRILPLLSDWSDQIVFHSNCSHDVLFFTDDKRWKMCRPGRGAAAEALTRNWYRSKC